MAKDLGAAYEALNLRQQESESDSFTVERYEQFFRRFPRDARDVLDVGCNTGRGGAALIRLEPSLRITGLDCVQTRLDRLPPGVYANSLLALSTEIPRPDYTFDAIVAGEFIEHLYSADVAASLAEFFRVLRLGGRLLLTTPNPDDLKRKCLHKTVLGGAHLSQHFPAILRIQLQMAGFSRIRTVGSGKTSRFLGQHFPLLAVYGSYLMTADKF